MDHEDRIALFLDYENLALGFRDHHGGMAFDFRPIADALAERGRVVVRRAYADWSYFDEDRRMLTRNHVELIEIPQRMGATRKNAADIKMAVDAVELAFERDYISTFVICTGDSDFTPLVHKLRELNKRVVGVGVEKSTSALLPPACDEFLYYDRLEGVEIPPARVRGGRGARPAEQEAPRVEREPERQPEVEEPGRDVDTLAASVAQTVAGLQGSSGGEVTASRLRTRRSASPTTASARSANCSGTSPRPASSSWPRGPRRVTRRSPCPSTVTGRWRSGCSGRWWSTSPTATARWRCPA
ncbi:NYN domain-containing protein [Micromonospora globbae]|uniref:NYN domain-containing protein n=1 Tax=Micromonospora globbae TaxID=1894969 RepID=UPI00386AA621|nr:NYN domain-containing protein [Micromonospora globbae]